MLAMQPGGARGEHKGMDLAEHWGWRCLLQEFCTICWGPVQTRAALPNLARPDLLIPPSLVVSLHFTHTTSDYPVAHELLLQEPRHADAP